MTAWRWFRADGDTRRHAFSREVGGIWMAACGAQRTRRCAFVPETGAPTPACDRCDRITRETQPAGDPRAAELRWYLVASGRWHLAHAGETGYRSLCGIDIIPRRTVGTSPEHRTEYFSCLNCTRAKNAMEAAA